MKKPVFLRGSAVEPKGEKTGEKPGENASESETTEQELNGAAASDELEAVLTGDSFESQSDPTDAAEQAAKIDEELIQRLQAEVKDNYDKYLRAVAELENYKKRALRERADILKYAGENLARDLLEIADTFQLAMANVKESVDPDFVKGVQMIFDRFVAILQQHSVRSESGLGGSFDPNKQQALASVPTTEAPPGTVLEEFKKAYFFKDKLLRPGQVVVSVQPEGSDGLVIPPAGGGQSTET
ncbi:MAG: nucleotide exchange factor GrpE [Bdellovibrionota bacterium]